MQEEQAAKLHAAIDAAQGYGNCVYAYNDGSPCCVVAQLFALEGLPPWLLVEGRNIGGQDFDVRDRLEARGYPLDLMLTVQRDWDVGQVNCSSLNNARAAMHAQVNEWMANNA